MTDYQMIIDTLASRLVKVWQEGYRQESWNEENAKELANTILRDVEIFKMRKNGGGDV